jgi:putative FmdB family regulatory protein
MPMYDYECPKCGEITEEIRSIANCNDGPICEKDGEKMVKVMISAPSLRKGGGIYSIDIEESGQNKPWGDLE